MKNRRLSARAVVSLMLSAMLFCIIGNSDFCWNNE